MATFGVVLIRGQFTVDGEWRYDGDQLPDVGEEIAAENVLTGEIVQARVTRVTPGTELPIGATAAGAR